MVATVSGDRPTNYGGHQSAANISERRVRFGADARWWVLLTCALALVLLVNPIGYIGGGLDDAQYLSAARCWREFGPCLPQDHWQARWPVIAPLFAITALFGESRLTVSLAPLLASIACIGLLASIGNRLFGKPIGFVAALLFLVAPAFSIQILEPSVEATELALMLAAFAAVLAWERQRTWYWCVLAGLAAGLAVQVRETAVVGAVFGAAYLCTRSPRPRLSQLAFAFVGFAIPLAIECAAFAFLTGDYFYRFKLSLNHTRIPSTELLVPIDYSRSALFNMNYVAHWKREAGIYLFWPIDGLLNLLASGKSGLLFLYAPMLLLFARSNVAGSIRRAALRLWLSSFAYACVLIYVFAIDPKSRMMFAVLAMDALAIASITIALWRANRRMIPWVVWSTCAASGLFLLFSHPRTWALEGRAEQWIQQYPGEIETDGNTVRQLALVPSIGKVAPLDSQSRYLIHTSRLDCGRFQKFAGVAANSLSVIDHVHISRMGWLEPKLRGELCLFRYEREVDAAVIREAIRLSEADRAPAH